MSTRTPSRTEPATRGDLVSLGLTIAGLVAAVLLVASWLRIPAHIEQVTIENPHPWPVDVAATAPGHGGWVGLGPVDQDDQKAFHDVIDQGDQWVFRFSYAGRQTELTVTRAQLDHDDWHVTVPGDVARLLREAGVPEAPSR